MSTHQHHHDEPHPHGLMASSTSAQALRKHVLWWCFIIITVFMLLEAVGGWLTGSLALLSDAGHMLSDAIALGATLLAFVMGERAANQHKTFGYRRFEILVAGINGATLVLIGLMIIYEAVVRIQNPPPIASLGMLSIATVGLVVNVVVAWLLHRNILASTAEQDGHSHQPGNEVPHQRKAEVNLNMHSAYLHVLGDLLGSVAAMVAAGLIMGFGWYWADPVASVLVAVLILVSGYRVVKQSVHILMEGVPQEVSLVMVEAQLRAHQAVCAVHDLHVWSISSGLHVMTGHVVVSDEMTVREASGLVAQLADELTKLGIAHSTIQVEASAHGHGDSLVCTLQAPAGGECAHGHQHTH